MFDAERLITRERWEEKVVEVEEGTVYGWRGSEAKRLGKLPSGSSIGILLRGRPLSSSGTAPLREMRHCQHCCV